MFPYVISIDPGLVNLGWSFFGRSGNLEETGLKNLNVKYPPDPDQLTRSLIKFVEKDLGWRTLLTPLVVVVETNDVQATRHVSGIVAGIVVMTNKLAEIKFVHPRNVAQYFKTKGTPKLPRHLKKKLTLQRMNQYFGVNPPLTSFDVADSVQNYLYVKLRTFSKPPVKNPWLTLDALPRCENQSTNVLSESERESTGCAQAAIGWVSTGGGERTDSVLSQSQESVDDYGSGKHWDPDFPYFGA